MRTPRPAALLAALTLALARCGQGEVSSEDAAPPRDREGDPWGDLMWADPKEGEDAAARPDEDGALPPDDAAAPDATAPADAITMDAPAMDAASPPAAIGESCAGGRACGAGLRCACRSTADCFCTRTCGEGMDPCPAPTACAATPLGSVCVVGPAKPPPGSVGTPCGEGNYCPAGLRCACGAASGCLCTRPCSAGGEACPSPTTCTTTPLGGLCLPPAPPPPPPDAAAPAPDVPVPPPDAPTPLIDVPVTTERVPACIRTSSGGEGGGLCGNLSYAYSARGINAGYYPFRVRYPVVQFSGEFDGDVGRAFVRGARAAGVVLQTVQPGSYVALSSTGPNYDPPTDCEVDECGNASRHACTNDSPPLRAPAGGGRYYWGYAYQGASHMQGWFLVVPGTLEFVGFDASHPCALGPAGADYEVRQVCGRRTACRGTNPTCGAVNRCDEGSDDCGRTQCGAMSGGNLTPTAHRRTVALPSSTHACTREPPHPSVRCLENGRERDFFFVYPFGAYLYWAQNSTTKAWLHYGDRVQVYFHNRDAQGVLWDFVEVTQSGAPTLTPASDGSGAAAPCSDTNGSACRPCRNGGTCGWVQDVFLR